MSIIGKGFSFLINLLLVPVIAVTKAVLRVATLIWNAVTTIAGSFPLNVIAVLGLVIAFVMWLWPSPFTIATVISLRINELFTNILLPALNFVYQESYIVIVPFYNDGVEFSLLFLEMFWGGACKGAAPFSNVVECQGIVDSWEMIRVTWQLWTSYYNLAVSIVMALYDFFVRMKDRIEDDISARRAVLMDMKRRGALDDSVRIPLLFCEYPLCSAWDGTTPKPITNMRREPMPDDSVRGKFLFSGTSWGPPGFDMVRKSTELSKLEVKIAQVMVRVALFFWNLWWGDIVPVIVQLSAFQVDLMRIGFALFEDLVEIALDLLGTWFLFFFEFFYHVVGGTLGGDPDILDYGPEYINITLIANYTGFNSSNFSDDYRDEYFGDGCNVTNWVLDDVTVGPLGFKHFLQTVRNFLWDLACQLLNLPVDLLATLDKVICLIEYFPFCIPFEDFLCAWTFGPPAMCTVVQPVCLLWNDDRTGPGEVGVPEVSFGFEVGDNPYAMIDTFHLIRAFTKGDHANILQMFNTKREVEDFDWEIDYYSPKRCEIYKQGKYAEPYYSLSGYNESELHDPDWDTYGIGNGVFKYADPEKLQCNDFLSPENGLGNITDLLVNETVTNTLNQLREATERISTQYIYFLVTGDNSTLVAAIDDYLEIYQIARVFIIEQTTKIGMAYGQIAKYNSDPVELINTEFDFWRQGYFLTEDFIALTKPIISILYPFGNFNPDEEYYTFLPSLLTNDKNITYRQGPGFIDFTSLLIPDRYVRWLSDGSSPIVDTEYLNSLVDDAGLVFPFTKSLLGSFSVTDFMFTYWIASLMNEAGYTEVTNATMYIIVDWNTYLPIDDTDSEAYAFIFSSGFMNLVQEFLDYFIVLIEDTPSPGYAEECFCGYSERHNMNFDCDPIKGDWGPIKACGSHLHLDQHGFFYPWAEDLEVFLEELRLGFIWRIMRFFGVTNALEEAYWEFQKLIQDVFYSCHEELAGNCPCDACEVDKSQWIPYLVNKWVFGFGDSSLSGATCNPNHPDPDKRCCSKSPYYSKMWWMDENFSFLDLFDECKVCPTPSGCQVNPYCPCEETDPPVVQPCKNNPMLDCCR